jgi:hypothetical protein
MSLAGRMLETPVTSAPIVAGYLSNLPAYRTGVSPLLRGVEIGLAHGFFLVRRARSGPWHCPVTCSVAAGAPLAPCPATPPGRAAAQPRRLRPSSAALLGSAPGCRASGGAGAGAL